MSAVGAVCAAARRGDIWGVSGLGRPSWNERGKAWYLEEPKPKIKRRGRLSKPPKFTHRSMTSRD